MKIVPEKNPGCPWSTVEEFVKCSQALKFEYICTHTNRLKPFSFQNNKLHSFPLTPQNVLPVCHYFVFELSTCKIHLKKCDCSEETLSLLPTYWRPRLGLHTHTHTLLDCAADPTHAEYTAQSFWTEKPKIL